MAVLALAEDDVGYRGNLEATLKFVGGHDIAATFSDGATAVSYVDDRLARGQPPGWELFVTDLEMPILDGVGCVLKLKERLPDLPVLVLSAFEDPPRICDAIAAGADGYVLKKASPDEIIEHVRVALAGGAPLTPAVARHVLRRMQAELGPGLLAEGSDRDAARLTGREHDVLRCLVMGQAYKEVADELGISIDTVRTHIRGLYRKLHVQNVGAAVAAGIRRGLV